MSGGGKGLGLIGEVAFFRLFGSRISRNSISGLWKNVPFYTVYIYIEKEREKEKMSQDVLFVVM